ncbi:SDR family oxidoreductase (plasmid) [Streptomycetaceae bacterium NBC_01309]
MKPLFDLTGTAAVVTGSSRGIGLAVARALLAQGADVVVNGRDPAETTEVHKTLTEEYPAVGGRPRVVASAGDVTDPTVAPALIAASLDAFGRIDHVVCNAGMDIIKPAVDYGPDEWDRILAVNLRGAFLPAQAAARHWMAESEPGSVTMTSSIAGCVGIAFLAPYAASKGGINQLVRTLAAEWASHSIRVNAVAPGYAANTMAGVTVQQGTVSDRRIKTFTPMARRATLEEIAAPYAFLASPAAGFITGSVLAVDGGYTAT